MHIRKSQELCLKFLEFSDLGIFTKAKAHFNSELQMNCSAVLQMTKGNHGTMVLPTYVNRAIELTIDRLAT